MRIKKSCFYRNTGDGGLKKNTGTNVVQSFIFLFYYFVIFIEIIMNMSGIAKVLIIMTFTT